MLKHFSLPFLASVLIIIASSYLLLLHTPQLTSYPTTHNPQPNTGCIYQQVQCIHAPCDPILVCVSPHPNIPSPTPTNIPASSGPGWKITSSGVTKTYTNLKYNLQFTAPVKYEFSSGSSGYYSSEDSFGLAYDNPETIHNAAPDSDFASVSFFIHPIPNSTFSEFVSSAYEDHKKIQKDYGTESRPLKPIAFGGKPGFEYSGSFLIPNLTKLIQIGGGNYLQVFITINDLKNTGYQKEVDQIFRSFKFLNNPSPTCISRPKCLDATGPARCLMPETSDMCPPPKPSCDPCPQLMPPHPNLCRNGVLIAPSPDECGCSSPPSCFTCPPSGWVNCMPGPGPAKPQCQKEYLAWIQSNCPDFKGVAY